jgi:hypothetical protein
VLIMPYTTRVLPPDEWHRLATECPTSPLAAIDLSTVYGHLLVLEDAEGRIVGHWPLVLVWHAEPLYIEPGERNAASVKALVRGLQSTIAAEHIPLAFAMIEDPAMQAMATKLGFTPTAAPMYHAMAPEAALPELDLAALQMLAPPPQETP